jgi:hypothetical protein
MRRDAARACGLTEPRATQNAGKRRAGTVRRSFATPADLARSAPIGDPTVRILAGFNILVIAGVVGLAAARIAELVLPHTWWVILGVWALGLLAVHWVLTELGPLWWRPWVQALASAVVVLAAAFVAAPLEILILTGTGLSTAGRVLARQLAPGSPSLVSCARRLRGPCSPPTRSSRSPTTPLRR